MGFPSAYAFTLFTVTSISRILASFEAHAMCGVISMFFALSRGLSSFGGSVESTVITSYSIHYTKLYDRPRDMQASIGEICKILETETANKMRAIKRGNLSSSC